MLDWYECGGGEGAEPTFGDDYLWRYGRGDCRGPLDAPQQPLPRPPLPRPPTADIAIALARARHGRFLVAVARPDRRPREWKLFSWPHGSVGEWLRDELERHEGQWAEIGADEAVLVASERATTAADNIDERREPARKPRTREPEPDSRSPSPVA